jgi:hypothetical protein
VIHRTKEHQKAYFTAYNKTAADSRLSWKATGLLLYLLSLPPKWKICKEQLIKVHTDGRTSTCAAFDELVDAGYIVWRDNEWHVHETPKDVEKEGTDDTLKTNGSNQQSAQQALKIDREECRKSTSNHVENQHLVSNKEKESKKEGTPSSPLFSLERDNSEDVGSGKDATVVEAINDSELNKQAEAILSQYPNKKNLSYGVPALRKRIMEVGYENLLQATKAFAASVKEQNKQGNQASYFFGEEAHYLAWLPVSKEPLQPRVFDEPSDMTSEEVAEALDVMEDALWVFYTGSKPDYAIKHTKKDDEDFREGAKICFYNNYNPRSYVANALEVNSQYHSPALLHSKEAEARYNRYTHKGIVSELLYYYSRDTGNYNEVVIREMQRRGVMREEVLLDEATSIPAWYRVAALDPDNPKLAEVQEKWGREGRLEMFDMQHSNDIEVFFGIKGIFAGNLFPFYAGRYKIFPPIVKPAVANGAAPESTCAARVTTKEEASNAVSLETLDPLTQDSKAPAVKAGPTYEEVHGHKPPSREDALAYLRGDLTDDDLKRKSREVALSS